MTSTDPDALRVEIARTRADLGETVEALAAKADVKARVRDSIDEATERAQEFGRDLPDNARAAIARLGRKVRERPAPFAAVGALIVVLALIRWRRNR